MEGVHLLGLGQSDEAFGCLPRKSAEARRGRVVHGENLLVMGTRDRDWSVEPTRRGLWRGGFIGRVLAMAATGLERSAGWASGRCARAG